MKKVLLLFVILAVNAMAQDAPKPTDTASLKLDKIELMEWRNIQLQGEVIQSRIKDLQASMKSLEAQLADLNQRVLDARKLDAKEYTPNWQAGVQQVVKKSPETAKK